MPPPFSRGHVRAPNKDHLMTLSERRRRGTLPTATEPTWDSCALGWVPPIKDQSQCGSCWRFSGIGMCEIAYWMAGFTNVILSEEYGLDCQQGGGCNGDDNTTVLIQAKATGNPLTSDYGPYTSGSGRTGQCHFKPQMTLYKIDDWGFVDGGQGNGVTPTQQIKDAIKQYGCVGCAVAAGSSWDSWTSDPNYVHKGNSRNIDHDVILVGWDDSKGAWKMRNSWGTGWAWNGYGWIAYGADSIGTEAVWASINAVAPPIDVYNWTP